MEKLLLPTSYKNGV